MFEHESSNVSLIVKELYEQIIIITCVDERV